MNIRNNFSQKLACGSYVCWRLASLPGKLVLLHKIKEVVFSLGPGAGGQDASRDDMQLTTNDGPRTNGEKHE
jgi:hypothetical protein